ncbi:rhodanese-like domain-containing protein [Thalassospira sp.]|uniref:rhodanese-like domain-containing protein n=1 Tax=Thalassospira sp. TaxID=1912094 RepID=UPI002736FA2B|nr:rhodanese-like domain-containing protein [Thalassospira sp.]MDP2697379.1 rhodanese-like domain-containing protein [Thalassospira sp.]
MSDPSDLSDEMTGDSVTFITSTGLAARIREGGVMMIDVRDADDFAAGHIAGAINIPPSGFDIPVLVDLIEDAPTSDDGVVFICAVGQRSFGAASAMHDHLDCPVASLKGGIQGWVRDGFDLVGC